MAIVFIHRGYSPYLEFSLRQARAASPESDIVLLGDASNDRFSGVRHVDTGAAPYAGVGVGQAYRHLSTNSEPFERACLDRWFLLRAFLEAEGLSDALVLDSDVMLYATEAELRAHVGHVPCAFSRPAFVEPYAWAVSPHVSFWTAEALADFCAFVGAAYTEPSRFARYEAKWQYYLDHGVGGGISDMTALYLFAEERPDAGNVGEAQGGVAVEHNLNVADNAVPGEYRTDGRFKALAWSGERPSGENLLLGAPVRFLALHCQGHAKGEIPGLYRGPAFPGQRAAARAVRASNGARRLASWLVRPVRQLRSRLAS